jgi:tRNA dimethylallyltransferase
VDRLLIVIAGPTGAGKTSLALDIAVPFDPAATSHHLASPLAPTASPRGEIVNCDSLQLYRNFDVGTAKTPVAARRNIPHHLFDVLEPANGYSAGDYARLARQAIAEIAARGRMPIVVGGAGFYLRALLQGLPDLPSRDETLRARLQTREQRRPGSLHRLLTRLEPATAGHIHPRDVQKTIRAVEIRLLTGTALPRPDAASTLPGFRILKIGLNPERSQLFKRLDRRVEAMFSGGLIEEVRSLLARGATGDEKPFESLGYRQALQYIRGEVSLEQAILSTQTGTRQYAKRQLTWFRRDPEIRWLNGFGDDSDVVRQALELLAELAGQLSERVH